MRPESILRFLQLTSMHSTKIFPPFGRLYGPQPATWFQPLFLTSCAPDSASEGVCLFAHKVPTWLERRGPAHSFERREMVMSNKSWPRSWPPARSSKWKKKQMCWERCFEASHELQGLGQPGGWGLCFQAQRITQFRSLLGISVLQPLWKISLGMFSAPSTPTPVRWSEHRADCAGVAVPN